MADTAEQAPAPTPAVKSKAKKQRCTLAERSGLKLRVSRVKKLLNLTSPIRRVSLKCSLGTTGVGEYIITEVLLAAAQEAEVNGHKRITPLDIKKAIMQDADLHRMFDHVVFVGCGNVPSLQAIQAASRSKSKREGETPDPAQTQPSE